MIELARGIYAVFDIGLFRNMRGLVLRAATECYPNGSREEAIDPSRFGLRLSMLDRPMDTVVPILVTVRSPNDSPSEHLGSQWPRLLGDFKRALPRPSTLLPSCRLSSEPFGRFGQNAMQLGPRLRIIAPSGASAWPPDSKPIHFSARSSDSVRNVGENWNQTVAGTKAFDTVNIQAQGSIRWRCENLFLVEQLLEGLIVKREVRHQLLEPVVLLLQPTKPSCVRQFQPSVLDFPLTVSLLG